jgi:hypothetical protein
VPTVQESNGRYAVAIAPGVVLRWWFVSHRRRSFLQSDHQSIDDLFAHARLDAQKRATIVG